MIRVVLADDEAMIRAGIQSILATDPGIEVVAVAGDGREAVEMTFAHQPDVVLMDVRMPRLDGLTAAAQVREVAKVIVLTTFDEDDYVTAALDAGAAGFLLKACDPQELLLGVHAVADGGAYLSPRIAKKVIARWDEGGFANGSSARETITGLTERERAVLAGVGRGLSNHDIGAELFVAESTVKAHVSGILRRLGLNNRVQAAILAHEAGLTGH
ncbi:response regulator transcription factor [Nocardia sp. CNY236]|uniref:response regulator n=1 Tax=Nocardia sp. CNY236 TaxID=1169152 RepID=UPI0003FDFBAC|nr:response regulator transcription factor [Nocardia sp. CNY236]